MTGSSLPRNPEEAHMGGSNAPDISRGEIYTDDFEFAWLDRRHFTKRQARQAVRDALGELVGPSRIVLGKVTRTTGTESRFDLDPDGSEFWEIQFDG